MVWLQGTFHFFLNYDICSGDQILYSILQFELKCFCKIITSKGRFFCKLGFLQHEFLFCFQAVLRRDVSLQFSDGDWEHTQPKKPAERAVMSCKLTSIPILLNPSDAFLFSPSWTHLLLPLNCGGFSDSKHSDAKEFPRGVVLLLVQRTPLPPLPPGDHDTTNQIFWAWMQCRSSFSTPADSHGGWLGCSDPTLFTPSAQQYL